MKKPTKAHRLTLENGKQVAVIGDKLQSCKSLAADLKHFKQWNVKTCCGKPLNDS